MYLSGSGAKKLGRAPKPTSRRGVDRMVLARLVNDAALDGEAARLGLSTGDEAVRDQVMATPAFQGPDGKFGRDTYVDALERIGLRPADFEDAPPPRGDPQPRRRRRAVGRHLPASEALAVLAFLGERRSFDWLRLDAALLPTPIPAPDRRRPRRPSTRPTPPTATPAPRPAQLSYASVTPRALAATIEIPDADLRAAYDADDRPATRPRRRRALDRIGFATEAEAAAGQGADRRRRRPTSTRSPPSAASSPATSTRASSPPTRSPPRRATPSSAPPGPASSARSPPRSARHSTGSTPIMAAKTTPFEEAKAELAKDRALEQAKQQIADDTAHIEDLIAGGATLEEIASETAMELGNIALNSETKGGLADDPTFRDAAAKAETGEETDLVELADGGLATLRVDQHRPARGHPARPRSATGSPPTGPPTRPPRRCTSSPTATSAS